MNWDLRWVKSLLQKTNNNNNNKGKTMNNKFEIVKVVYGDDWVEILTETNAIVDKYNDLESPHEFAFGYAEAINSTPNTQAIIISNKNSQIQFS